MADVVHFTEQGMKPGRAKVLDYGPNVAYSALNAARDSVNGTDRPH